MNDKASFVRCPSCRSLIPAGLDECRMCGPGISNDCPECQKLIPSGESVCSCGYELPKSEDTASVARYFFIALLFVTLILIAAMVSM